MELKKQIRDEIVESLKEYNGGLVSELSYDLYNQDFYIIGYADAENFLKENFEDMLEALNTYQENFGVAYEEITNVEKLASLVALNTCEIILSECEATNKYWDEELTEEIANEIIKELEEMEF